MKVYTKTILCKVIIKAYTKADKSYFFSSFPGRAGPISILMLGLEDIYSNLMLYMLSTIPYNHTKVKADEYTTKVSDFKNSRI